MPAIATMLPLEQLALELITRASHTTDEILRARACEASRALGQCAGRACQACPLYVGPSRTCSAS